MPLVLVVTEVTAVIAVSAAKQQAQHREYGIELQSARYATPQAGGRIARYEIVLPVSGSYAQIRDFLKRALAEIPVLSLDQMALKRDNRTDGTVAAELHLTLHLVRP